MKRNLLLVFAAVLLATTIVSAQSQVQIEIPFPFTVGKAEQPAGVWVVSQSSANPHLQTFHRVGGTEKFMAMSGPLYGPPRGPGAARAVFNRYEGQYFLSEVWRSGASGVRFVPGKAEREFIAARLQAEKVPVIAGTK
jgi:hypothetical protein